MHLALVLCALLWKTWHTSAVIERNGTPVFTVDGRPFFVYGAAFFYERTPVARWRTDLERYRAMGINTIDLYLIWNWHEPDPHTIDFDGHTNPQRNLYRLFALIHQLGFKVIVRPGPVIRNEWRNGGYPDWLLERPAYNMPLHDILEGRYPATATLQNAHADAAANEWLHNPVHLHYAARWLHDVLTAIEPWSHDVIAIALDDDQGAYLDNDTYPAPHWHAYMNWLKARVQSTVGTRVPLFINTYQMKETASAPVWAWGNWYQSDAYRIGEHDILQLAFSFGLLQTQVGLPVMASEFQAGWLQGADQTSPRPSAPQNTTIALHEMLHMGLHGVVNFPVQDTRNPAGYEAPWANWFYGWDAALDVNGNPSPRYAPTAAFGRFVERYGPLLATMQPKVDRFIAWRGNPDATIAQFARCRALALTCRVYDPRYQPHVPALHGPSSTGGLHDAALLVTPDGRRALLDIFNPSMTSEVTPRTSVTVGGRRYPIAPQRIAGGGALDIPLGFTPPPAPRAIPLPRLTPLPVAWRAVAPGEAIVYALDVFHDEMPTYVLDNGIVRIVVSADAGARSFIYEDDLTGKNYFNSIGAARDDVANPPTPSPRDYIAAYTHPIPAGTFNRPYRCHIDVSGAYAALTCTYTAPDFGPKPVTFTKTFSLLPDADDFTVTRPIPNGITTTYYRRGESWTITGIRQSTPQGAATATPIPRAAHALSTKRERPHTSTSHRFTPRGAGLVSAPT
ncbi:MAG TPA: beta-galactosidase [Candidatus Baltobacteraceae bacterium]|nr:beta-galactosidase [Candidatus Baltobacteraceae bacterium]